MSLVAEDYNLANSRQDIDRATADQFAKFWEAYNRASEMIKDVVKSMAFILNDRDADPDEKAAAADTLMEALFPSRMGRQFGADIDQLRAVDAQGQPLVDAETEARQHAFASKVRDLMHKAGLTQAALASKLGIGQPAVAMFLRRKCRPQRATIAKIAKALGVTPSEIWPA